MVLLPLTIRKTTEYASKQTLLLRGLKSIFDCLFLLKLAQVVLINFTKKEVFEMVFDC